MGERARDWLEQAKSDLGHADNDVSGGYYEWACFFAQQAAEKAPKAVYQAHNQVAWGMLCGSFWKGCVISFRCPMD